MLHTSNNENTVEKTNSSVNSNTGNSEASSSDQLSVKEDTQESAKAFFSNKQTNTMLATMRVTTKNAFGKNIVLRCLVDPGSQASFMTHSAYKRLGLKGNPTNLEINGLNQKEAAWANYHINVNLTSCHNKEASVEVDLYIINSITDTLPSKTLQPSDHWTHLQGISLADPSYWKAAPIDILLGVDVYTQIVQSDIRKGPKNAPIAIRTLFGWIILGNCPTKSHERGIKSKVN